MKKHTPGPWIVGTRNPMIRTVSIYHPYTNLEFTTTDGKGLKWLAEVETNANAQLIAAAPDLLKALQDAQAHLEYCNYGDNWERECAKEQKLSEKIEAAIEKATV